MSWGGINSVLRDGPDGAGGSTAILLAAPGGRPAVEVEPGLVQPAAVLVDARSALEAVHLACFGTKRSGSHVGSQAPVLRGRQILSADLARVEDLGRVECETHGTVHRH